MASEFHQLVDRVAVLPYHLVNLAYWSEICPEAFGGAAGLHSLAKPHVN